MCFI
ncbi:hypothetical protein D046_8312A, partial [Vibrio parahaemolyticus V-223/04]